MKNYNAPQESLYKKIYEQLFYDSENNEANGIEEKFEGFGSVIELLTSRKCLLEMLTQQCLIIAKYTLDISCVIQNFIYRIRHLVSNILFRGREEYMYEYIADN